MSFSCKHIEAVKELRSEPHLSYRAIAPQLEDLLYQPIPVLDHGFIRVIDYMGTDEAIVQAARVSYGKGTKKVNQDQGLINYLMRHRHTTPFEMCEIKFHIKLPIFIARQWIRHRTANVNEYSGRYSVLSKEFYVPKAEHLAAQSTNNRQGRGDTLSPERAAWVLETLKQDSERAYDHYEQMMNQTEEGDVLNPNLEGLTRELARMSLSLNYYTEWYWKVDLHNLLHFLSLRADSHAQYEIRVYADAMLDIVKKWVPYTYEAFCRYKMNAVHVSQEAVQIIHRLLKGEKVTHETSGLSQREWHEFVDAMGLETYLQDIEKNA